MLEVLIDCRRCGMKKPPSKSDSHLCEECVRAENSRVSFYRQHNFNWIEVAKDADLEIWERQPAETDHEYNVWLHYRDAYPGKKPTFKGTAEELGITINAVRKIASRWSFPARLQSWAAYIDQEIVKQRKQEILDMNKRHVDMAQRLNEKLAKAIDLIDPYALSPREINSLFKTAAELETKARIAQEVVRDVAAVPDEDLNLKKMDVKSENINEIIGILGKAGVLNNFGVRQTTTTTTEVVVQGDDDD